MNGLLNINKPIGITSRDVVNRVQRLIRPIKVGHAGTLDPLATGVLVLCLGKATRLISYVQDAKKSYRGTFELGKTSDTDDLEGEIVSHELDREIHRADVETLLPQFTGTIEQIPPRYSAVHVNGRRAYQLARKGEAFEIAPREVTIHSLSLTDWDFPRFTLEIVCGSGTYIRSLGRDLGERLGCGAVMTSLERTAIGSFFLENAISLDDLTREQVESALIPSASAVRHLPKVSCESAQFSDILDGKKWPAPDGFSVRENEAIAVVGEAGELVCLAAWNAATGLLQPRQVFLERE